MKEAKKRYTKAELKAELEAAGVRATVQRIAILGFMRENPVHPTADVVYDALCEERKEGYGGRDAELRRQLLERNDARCRALDDSLRWVLSLR